jgi:bifunctional non-homologous end joining protein LigD
MKPDDYNPQKALLVGEPPSGDRWIHELKLDGFRMGLFIRRGGVTIVSRRGTEYSAEYPEIVAAARRLGVRDAVIDGEVVVLDTRGVPSFQRLQQLSTSREGLTYFAFDLLALNGKDLTTLPLVERKARLLDLIGDGNGVIRYTQHFETDGRKVLDQACALGAEGIVSKLRDGVYRIGARSSDWQKIKCVKRQEFVVGGFTDPSGSRVGVGSMLIGYYEDAGGGRSRGKKTTPLRFAGKVGAGRGWGAEFGRELRRKLETLEIDESPFTPRPPGWLGRNAHWVRPTLVAEVEFTEWTESGQIRHPSLQGFRSDKRARQVVREREQTPAAAVPTAMSRGRSAKPPATRVVYPRLRITTDDLVSLYSDIAEWALPHVEGRPLTLVRMREPLTRPDALRSQAAFARHTAREQAFVPKSVPRIQIPEQKKIGEYTYVDSIASLIALLRAGVVEWHAWNARVDNVERPDRVVFDIDPGEGVPWSAVAAAARKLRKILLGLNLESWVKTTGGVGLHVVVPFRPEHTWEAVFAFSRMVADEMVREDPDRYTVSFDRARRKGAILIDYKRNHRTSIAVAGFSPRARPDGSISVPVKWEELGRITSDRWNVKNIRDRLRRLTSDPWEGYWSCRQKLVARE